jgi:hypothetical protein
MAKTTFTFTHDDGRVSKRRTERTYTHVVVARPDVAAMRDAAQARPYLVRHAQDYRYLATKPGAAIVAEFGSEQGYVDAKVAAHLAAIDKKFGADVMAGPEEVLQWSMSEANARKASIRQFYTAVRVAPVDSQDAGDWIPDEQDPTGEKADAALLAVSAGKPRKLNQRIK